MSVRKRPGSPYFWFSFNEGGHRFRGSTGKASKREAEDVERDQRLLARQSLARRQDWTLQMVLSTYYLEHGQDTRSANQILGHFADLQRILGKDKRASRLTDGDLMDYRARRRGERRRGRLPAANSINRELAYLRAAFEHCRRFHKQPAPAIDWKGLRAKEPPWRKRFAGRDEYARLIECAAPRLRPIIVCAVATGLREGNILELDWKQVNLDSRVIIVRVKGNKEHVVRITPALMAVLSTTPPEKRLGRVFDRTNFRRLWENARTAARMGDFRFHDLRHTFGSWARQAGADLADICEDLNHSSIGMTLRYAHVKADETITAADRVSARLLGTIEGTEAKKLAENREK
jgi:integrase